MTDTARDAGPPLPFVDGEAVRQRERAEVAEERFRRFAQVAGSLVEALTPERVVEVVLAESLATLDATAAAIARYTPDRRELELLGAVGYDEQVLEVMRRLPAYRRTMLTDAARTNEVVVFRNLAERQALYPNVPPTNAGTSAAAVPLAVSGRAVGAMTVTFAADRDFSDADVEFLQAVGRLAAAVLRRVRLFAAEMAALEVAERSEDRLQLLAEASRLLGGTMRSGFALQELVRLVVGQLADWCTLHLLQGEGRVELAAVAAAAPEQEALLRQLLGSVRLHDPGSALASVLRTGQARLSLTDRETVLAGDATAGPWTGHRQSWWEDAADLSLSEAVSLPLVARGTTIGALTVAPRSGSFGLEDMGLAGELASRAALSVDNTRAYQHARDIALTLQRSLLPQELPTLPGVALAGAYLPGAVDSEVGGDWYDAVPLPSGSLGIAVGDVMGRGVRAAAVMGQLRATLRGYALEGHGPAAVLTRLDRAVSALDDMLLATCVYGVYDPTTGQLRLSSAGHVPPLLVGAEGGPRLLELDAGLPLGVGGAGVPRAVFAESRLRLGPGESVVLYTDGLVEGRDCSVGEGLDLLREAAVGMPPEARAGTDALLLRMGRANGHDDDVALLTLNVEGTAWADRRRPVMEEAVRELPANPVAASQARQFVRQRLNAWGLPGLVDVAVLLTSELVGNATRHAGSPTLLRLVLDDEALRVAVSDEDPRRPRPQENPLDPEQEGGRGLWLVEQMAEDWGVEEEQAGKTVWFRLAAARDAVARSDAGALPAARAPSPQRGPAAPPGT